VSFEIGVSARPGTFLQDCLETREFQTQVLHYFSKSDNKSNHHHCGAAAMCEQLIGYAGMRSPLMATST
jgi:hypothetical protein